MNTPDRPQATWCSVVCAASRLTFALASQASGRAGASAARVIADPSEQPEALEAGVARAADHQVVVQGHADRGGGTLEFARHRDVGLRRRRVARWVVVHDD